MVKKKSWLNPIRDGVITSLGGLRVNPVTDGREFHDGVDIACPVGTEVFASRDGVVLAAGTSPTYGKYIKIAYPDGYTAMYAHLSKIKAGEGEEVERGQVIALSGSTGRSTGPHLHYSLYRDGQYVNASSYVSFAGDGA